jgi:RNA polymerase sigma factor (sigma-70 family)
MLRAFQHRHLLATEDDLMAWLTVVTGRLVIDRLRVRGRAMPVAEVPPQSQPGRDTAEVVVARDEARLALDALEAMPGRQASVLWAREVEGLSYDDIGERFGMSEPSVRSLLHRARKTLRREYAARGGSLPAVGLVALAPWITGLRHAGRLRHLARRGASAAAVAATGIVAVTASPFGGFAGPPPARPDLRPALGVVTTPVAASHPQRQATAAVVRHAPHAAAPSAATHAASTAQHINKTRLPGPHICGRHDYSVGCQTHETPTLYVGPALPVPVAGVHRVGVSNSTVDCTSLPTTPVTECDTRGATQ